MTPSTLLHPLKLDVVGFQEEEHDYHFRVELPEPKCCQSCGTLYNLVKFGKDDQAYRSRDTSASSAFFLLTHNTSFNRTPSGLSASRFIPSLRSVIAAPLCR